MDTRIQVDMLIMAIKSNKESGKSTDTWQQLIHSCIGSKRVSYPAFIWQGIANIASNLDCAKVFDRDHNKKLKTNSECHQITSSNNCSFYLLNSILPRPAVVNILVNNVSSWSSLGWDVEAGIGLKVELIKWEIQIDKVVIEYIIIVGRLLREKRKKSGDYNWGIFTDNYLSL